MTLNLYRVRYQETVTYAVLHQERYYFVDVQSRQSPLNEQRSAPAEECRILNPTQPTKIVGVGLNYRDHAAERNKPIPAEPLLFLKPTSALIAPGDPIILPTASQRIDPEGELAIVI